MFWRFGYQGYPVGFAAQATRWSAVKMHTGVMPHVRVGLARPFIGKHPEDVMARLTMTW